jgi:hypothetical protein
LAVGTDVVDVGAGGVDATGTAGELRSEPKEMGAFDDENMSAKAESAADGGGRVGPPDAAGAIGIDAAATGASDRKLKELPPSLP